MKSRSHAFTLVELLVVIGIIAILISILLPVLGSVRRQAAKAKCATQMRELGNAMHMYVNENKGYLPPPRLSTRYNVDGIWYEKGGPEVVGQSVDEWVKWWHFLGKYLTRNRTMAQNANDVNAIKNTVFWCPSFEGYTDGGSTANMQGGVNRNATGMGMNWWPSFKADYPPISSLNANGFPMASTPYQAEKFVDCTGGASGPTKGTWWKLSQFTRPGERAMLGEARQFYIEARKIDPAVGIPGQRLNFINSDYSSGVQGQTTFDFYRHGQYPAVAATSATDGYFKATGGKIGYNILFADNHVEAPTDRETAYRSVRMRFPG